MGTNIKSKQLEILLYEFELISMTALNQIQLVSKIMDNNALADALVNEVKENEMIIDRLEIKIREEVVYTIFRFNPIASDLRKIISYLELTNNLERVGDMLLNITLFIKDIDMSHPTFDELRSKLSKMLSHTHTMLRDAILAFSNSDVPVAYKVIEHDEKVDTLYHEIKKLLANIYSQEKLTPKDVETLLTIEAVSHNIERIGDSATNIAEASIYIKEGIDIRHANDK